MLDDGAFVTQALSVSTALADGDPYAVINLRRGRKALVSAEDAGRVTAYTWGVSTVTRKDGTQHGYANALINGRFTGMHRFVLGLTSADKIHVDHINGDSMDNRRENLRLASHSNNLKNLRADLRVVTSTGLSLPVAVHDCIRLPPPPKVKEPKKPRLRPLFSEMEVVVARFHLAGETTGEMAKTLSRSIKTISTVKSRLAIKLGFKSWPGDVRLAIALALLARDHLTDLGI